MDPATVPEERKNFVCQHAVSIRARNGGGRTRHVGSGRLGAVASAKAGERPTIAPRESPPPGHVW
eukprot:7493458-Lingulodinium_polyedra.AAC.1